MSGWNRNWLNGVRGHRYPVNGIRSNGGQTNWAATGYNPQRRSLEAQQEIWRLERENARLQKRIMELEGQ